MRDGTVAGVQTCALPIFFIFNFYQWSAVRWTMNNINNSAFDWLLRNSRMFSCAFKIKGWASVCCASFSSPLCNDSFTHFILVNSLIILFVFCILYDLQVLFQSFLFVYY